MICVNAKVLKYLLNIFRNTDEKEDSDDEHEYETIACEVLFADNICFHQIDGLDAETSFNVRVRAVMEDDDVKGLYSEWVSFRTKSDDETQADTVPCNVEVCCL